MGLLSLFKHEKLTIRRYGTSDRTRQTANPSRRCSTPSRSRRPTPSSGPAAGDERSCAQLNMRAASQGAQTRPHTRRHGRGDFGESPRAGYRDRLQADRGLPLTYAVQQGSFHEPRYLVVEWGGELKASPVASARSPQVHLFDRDGAPLRAELAARFVRSWRPRSGSSKRARPHRTSPSAASSRPATRCRYSPRRSTATRATTCRRPRQSAGRLPEPDARAEPPFPPLTLGDSGADQGKGGLAGHAGSHRDRPE